MSLTTKHLDWIGSLNVPADHKVVMVMLGRHTGPNAQYFVWPAMEKLAAASSLTQVRCEAVVNELVYLGLLTPREQFDHRGQVRIGWTVNLLTQPSASNPLFSLLLENQVWGCQGLTPMEQIAAALMTKFINWEDQSVALTYETVASERPKVTRQAWRLILKRLSRKGVLTSLGPSNQHAPSRYRFNIEVLKSLGQIDPGTSESLGQIDPGTSESLGQIDPGTSESLGQIDPGTSRSIIGTRAERDIERDRIEEEGVTGHSSSSLESSNKTFREILREQIARMRYKFGPGESFEPSLAMMEMTYVGWHEAWAGWMVDTVDAHYAAGRESPVGLMHTELRRLVQMQGGLFFLSPPPDDLDRSKRSGLKRVTGF